MGGLAPSWDFRRKAMVVVAILTVVVAALAASLVYLYQQRENELGQENGIPITKVNACIETLNSEKIFYYWANLLRIPAENVTWSGGGLHELGADGYNSTHFVIYVGGSFNYTFNRPVTSSSKTYMMPQMLWVQYCPLSGQ